MDQKQCQLRTHYGKPADLSYGKPASVSYAKPTNLSYDKPACVSYAKRADLSYDKPTSVSYAKPADLSYDKPTSVSYGKPADLSYGKPTSVSYGKPADLSYAKPANLITVGRLQTLTSVCTCVLPLRGCRGTMGLKAVESHMKGGKHQRYVAVASHSGSRLIPALFAARPNDVTSSDATSQSAITSFISPPDTQKAELAKSFTCGENKTAYVAKYGIASFIKKELSCSVSEKPYVVMFDESLNKTTKNKQMDLHLRFWTTEDETGTHYVISRYYGSVFMGHSRAEDMLGHFNSLLRRFIKRDVQVDVSPVKLVKLDVTDQKLWVSPKQVDIGMGATAALKGMSGSQSGGSEREVLLFMRDSQSALSKICQNLLLKCPLKYPSVRNMMCLDPQNMHKEPDMCLQRIKALIMKFVQDKKLSGGVTAGDKIAQQFQKFLFSEARGEEFMAFNALDGKSRVDSFLHKAMNGYAELWSFVEKLLLLSHGQATVERGFSINKEVEMCNMNEDTIVSQRLICDYVRMCGGVVKVPLTKELLNECASARNRYRIFLEDERKKKEQTKQMNKRKEVEDELEELRKKRRTISTVLKL
ncbi:hypothetical protein ROHU_001041 [Labeo rohita]|uniref:Uncharacterized protein n=1 Tax=Labeo rohita TaxID=84645 RepID=A0A498P1L6_LABRO|nr:hypothetical protein ROHU_001041 [Labeo rohita]